MSKCVFCFIYYNCIIILLSVTVFVCHDKGNGFFTINSPVCVYWKQDMDIVNHSAGLIMSYHISLMLWSEGWLPLPIMHCVFQIHYFDVWW